MVENKEVKLVKIDDIVPNRFQPRQIFGEKELNELADSIKEHGIIQPLIIRPLGDKYEIIAGERRCKAAILAGMQTVPVIIVDKTDEESAEMAIIENIQRKDLTPIEEANSYKKLINIGLTQEEIAQKLGVTQPSIANKLRLLNLTSEVQAALLYNKISERHARGLLRLESNDQINMLNRIINERLTVRQTDEEIDKILGKENIEKETPIFNEITPEIKQVEKSENIEILSPFTENEEILDIDELEEIQDLFKEENNDKKELSIPLDEENLNVKDDIQNKYKYLDTVNEARKFIDSCKLKGLKVESEEYDMEKEYQIIIRIEK